MTGPVRVPGIQAGTFHVLHLAEGLTFVSELSLTLDKRVRDETIEDLRTRYGAEWKTHQDLTWKVGPVEVSLTEPLYDGGQAFVLTYKHGRLSTLAYGALVEDKLAARDARASGL